MDLALEAVAGLRAKIPGIEFHIYGRRTAYMSEMDGLIARLGLQEVIRCPGFAPWEDVDAALCRALCLVLPSEREGYGLVVVEAAARGTPAIVVRAADNAATELVEHMENGIVVDSAAPQALAAAIDQVYAARPLLTRRTRAWFATHAAHLTLDATVNQLEALYGTLLHSRCPSPCKSFDVAR